MSKLGVLLFLTTLLLTALGLFILYESSSYQSLLQIGDEYFFLKRQSVFVGAGIIAALLISRIDYKKFYKLTLPLLLLSYILLIVVLIPGVGLELKGASRWLDFGLFVLQPSELLKISLTMYLAAWLSKKDDNRLIPFLLIMVFSAGIVAIEPDLGTAVIIATTAVIMYFLSNAKLKHLVMIMGIGLIGVMGLIMMEPYRVERLTAFGNVNLEELQETSYHTRQILLALGSGGITGVGFGNSIQKYGYLPESTTDSIFAIYAEEAGYIGSLLLLGVFFFQVYLGFSIASRAPDMFSKLTAAGITSFLAIQTLINIGSQAILVPITGAPLPFISYGGSSMMINYISIGILLAISRKIK